MADKRFVALHSWSVMYIRIQLGCIVCYFVLNKDGRSDERTETINISPADHFGLAIRVLCKQ